MNLVNLGSTPARLTSGRARVGARTSGDRPGGSRGPRCLRNLFSIRHLDAVNLRVNLGFRGSPPARGSPLLVAVRWFAFPAASTLAPAIVRSNLVTPRGRRGRAAGAIRFFRDGTSSGGEILLTLNKRRARISVNWLTGEARLDLAGSGPS